MGTLLPTIGRDHSSASSARGNGQNGDHAALLELAQSRLPALGALAIAVFYREQLLLAVGLGADHYRGAEPFVLEPDVEKCTPSTNQQEFVMRRKLARPRLSWGKPPDLSAFAVHYFRA